MIDPAMMAGGGAVILDDETEKALGLPRKLQFSVNFIK